MRGLAIGALMLAGCMSGGPVSAPAESVAQDATATATATATGAVHGPLVVADVVCERAVRCGTIGRSQLASCREGPGVSRLTLVWGHEDRSALEQRVASGRVKLAETDVQGCLEFLRDASCLAEPAEYPGHCQEQGPMPAIVAAVAPGGACGAWDECIDGYCTAQTGCEGLCVACSPIGGACGAELLCQDGAVCLEGQCRARAEVGAQCGGHWQGCKDGLMCDGYRRGSESRYSGDVPEQAGTCSAGKRLGEGCVPPTNASGEVCAGPLYCDWGEDAPVCRARLAAGATCRWTAACADGLVCAGLELAGRHPAGARYAVHRAGRCAPVLDAGDACEPTAFVSGCPAAMVCDGQRRVCRSTGHAGDACVSSWVTGPVTGDRPLRREGCFSGHFCDPGTRTCKPQLATGARCEPVAPGVEDSPCSLGQCETKTRRCAPVCEVIRSGRGRSAGGG